MHPTSKNEPREKIMSANNAEGLQEVTAAPPKLITHPPTRMKTLSMEIPEWLFNAAEDELQTQNALRQDSFAELGLSSIVQSALETYLRVESPGLSSILVEIAVKEVEGADGAVYVYATTVYGKQAGRWLKGRRFASRNECYAVLIAHGIKSINSDKNQIQPRSWVEKAVLLDLGFQWVDLF